MDQGQHAAEIAQLKERMDQMMIMLETLTRQRLVVDPPIVDPPPVQDGEDDWFEDPEPPRVDIPRAEREKIEKAEKERIEMKEKVEKLEKVVRKSNGVDSYLLELEGLFEGTQEKLPVGFKMPEIDKFDGSGNPRNHVRMCIGAFQPSGLSPVMMAMLFQQTLTGAALSWYFTMEPSKTRVWEEVVRAFVTQYEYNQELDVTVRDLETTMQDNRESFAEFLARWRGKAAKMTQRPSEKEQIRIIIKNLQSVYQEKLMYQCIHTFAELFEIGTRIEDAIKEGKIKKEDSQGSRSRRPFYGGNTGNQVATDVNVLSKEGAPRPRLGGQPRQFTDLGISLSTTLKRLMEKGYLKPLDPKPMPDPLPPGVNTNLYCEFHQTHGHTTDRCMRLRHEVQDLIDNKTISPPPINRPHVTRNPLPNHHAVPPPHNINLLDVEKEVFDPSALIVPVGQAAKPYMFPEDQEICLVGVEEEEWLVGGEEEQAFEEDIDNEILQISWWDPNNPADDSDWKEDEVYSDTDGLWSEGEEEENAEEMINHAEQHELEENGKGKDPEGESLALHTHSIKKGGGFPYYGSPGPWADCKHEYLKQGFEVSFLHEFADYEDPFLQAPTKPISVQDWICALNGPSMRNPFNEEGRKTEENGLKKIMEVETGKNQKGEKLEEEIKKDKAREGKSENEEETESGGSPKGP